MKSNGISFNSIYLDKSGLPEYFNLAVVDKISKLLGKSIEEIEIDGYTLRFENGIVYLVIESNLLDSFLRCIIANKGDNLIFDGDCILYEHQLIKRADGLRKIMIDYCKGSCRSKEMLEYYQIDSREMIEQLDESANQCIECINCINREYKGKILGEMRDSYIGIYYRDVDKISEKSVDFNGTGSFKGRVNEIIPVEDRISVLEGYEYLYKDYVYNDTSNGINYLCYLYQIDEYKYVLVLESFSGVNYTKVVMFNKIEEVTLDDFLRLAKYYLELSYEESLRSGGEMLRLAHTSLSVFQNNMAFFINGGVKGTRVSSRLRKRANELIGTASVETVDVGEW